MAQGGQGHGGGTNNINKKARARAAAAPAGPSSAITQAVRPPGGRHVVGPVPAPDEVTNRPSRRG